MAASRGWPRSLTASAGGWRCASRGSATPSAKTRRTGGLARSGYLAHLRAESDPAILRISRADKLHNARAILRDYLVKGDGLWARFKMGVDDQLWCYGELAAIFSQKLPGVLSDELAEIVGASAGGVSTWPRIVLSHSSVTGAGIGDVRHRSERAAVGVVLAD